MSGERWLHGWLRHSFGAGVRPLSNATLTARARQFSSFVVVIGRVTGAESIDPQHAFVVQNKDEVCPISLPRLPLSTCEIMRTPSWAMGR